VRKLLEVLHRLADLGNSVIIIEHNLDVIRNADWILDLGPEGGEDGGRVVGEGRPAKIAVTPGSYTGQFLARYYASKNGKLDAIEAEDAAAEINAAAATALPIDGDGAAPGAKRSKAKKQVEKHTGPRKKKTGIP